MTPVYLSLTTIPTNQPNYRPTDRPTDRPTYLSQTSKPRTRYIRPLPDLPRPPPNPGIATFGPRPPPGIATYGQNPCLRPQTSQNHLPDRVVSNLPTYLPTSYPPPASYLLPMLELGLRTLFRSSHRLRSTGPPPRPPPNLGIATYGLSQTSPDLLQTQESLHTAPDLQTQESLHTARNPCLRPLLPDPPPGPSS